MVFLRQAILQQPIWEVNNIKDFGFWVLVAGLCFYGTYHQMQQCRELFVLLCFKRVQPLNCYFFFNVMTVEQSFFFLLKSFFNPYKSNI